MAEHITDSEALSRAFALLTEALPHRPPGA